MKNFLFIIAFLIVLTTVIVGINPQMHKPMNIGGAKLEVQDNSNIKNTDLKVENKDSIIDKTPVAVKPVDAIKPVENIETKNVDINDKWEQLLKIQEQEEQARIQAEQKRQAQLQKQKEEYARKLAQQKAQEDAKRKAEALAKKQAEEQARKLAEQKATLNFSSPNFAEDLKKFLTNNVEFPKNDILQFSFFYNKTGTVAYIHLISISGKDYYDGNDYYATRVYGDTCMQDGLAENQVYVSDNSMKPELKAYLASATVDGEYLLRFYDIIKNIGKSHIIQVPVEKSSEFSTISGMHYKGTWHIYQ